MPLTSIVSLAGGMGNRKLPFQFNQQLGWQSTPFDPGRAHGQISEQAAFQLPRADFQQRLREVKASNARHQLGAQARVALDHHLAAVLQRPAMPSSTQPRMVLAVSKATIRQLRISSSRRLSLRSCRLRSSWGESGAFGPARRSLVCLSLVCLFTGRSVHAPSVDLPSAVLDRHQRMARPSEPLCRPGANGNGPGIRWSVGHRPMQRHQFDQFESADVEATTVLK